MVQVRTAHERNSLSLDPKPHALQRPAFLFARGAVRTWDDAHVHVATEAVIRGINVFEGLKGFWAVDGTFGIATLRRHYDRLHRSARIMRIPFTTSFEDYEAACHDLLARLLTRDRNMWLRTTLLLIDGHWGEGDVTDLVITAYHHPIGPAAQMATGVTAWRRANDNALPARIKTGANYLVARFSKIEGRSRGYREMILLNDAGRVAEFVSSAVLMVRDGTVITPPPSEGAFESITADLIETLARDLGIPFVRRPIERTELIVADEIASCGTLNDLVTITEIDGLRLGPAPILTRLNERYLAAVTGSDPHPSIDLSVVSPLRLAAVG
jgi:branched-chain amino acid aminotransferase